MAETNWAAQYVRYNLQRNSRQVFSCTQQNLSALGEAAQCALIAALITEMGSEAASTTEHPHFVPCASPGGHRAPDESRDLGETSPGRIINTWLQQFPAAHAVAAQTWLC